jgi:hypothetical protein
VETRGVTVSPKAETQPDQIQPVESDSVSAEVEAVGYDRPKKNRTKMFAGAVALLVPIAAGAIFLAQRPGSGSLDVIAPPTNAPVVGDSTLVAPPPVAVPESGAVVVNVDSQKIADSVKRAARAEAAKKAAAKIDSLKKVQQTPLGAAQNAVTAMLADAGARKLFTSGATHMGGVLGKQRRGDLQTQINALVPYLTQAGLGYEHFKLIVQNQGITLFDEFGRMKPDALQQFAGAGR